MNRDHGLSARIIPGFPLIEAQGLPGLRVSAGVKCESAIGTAGDMLTFGPGGRVEWEAGGLLGNAGSIVLVFAYKADSYHLDQPVLQVTGPDGRLVLAVTLGRVMFKIRRPPHDFAIDLYLNEREESWMRTVLSWERLDAERMYWRVSVNGRVYDRAIVPPFPEGRLSFVVAPETGRVRDVAFHDRPLPPELHPHINREPADSPDEETLRRRSFISEADQAALEARGGVVVFVPEGLRTNSLLSGLRLMGLDFQVVGVQELAPALRRAAVLILPDGDWIGSPALAGPWEGAPDARREGGHAVPPESPDAAPAHPLTGIFKAMADFVRRGGGLLALGEAAECVRRAGLAAFETHPAPMEGRAGFSFAPDSPVARLIPDDWARTPFDLNLLCRNGPHFSVGDDRSVGVVAVHPATGRPCALAARAGAGRVVLSSVMPFGSYFWHPTFENTSGPAGNAKPYEVFKAMLFHAAGIPFGTEAPPPVPREPREGSVGVDRSGGRRRIAFRVRADTLGLRDARPRNLFFMNAGEDTAQLYYDPRDQFLVFAAVTATGESVTVAREGTAWDGREWRHVAVTWEPTSTGDAAVEIRIDGRLAATGGMPLPRAPWSAPQFGDVDGMPGLDMTIRDVVDTDGASPDWVAIRAAAAAPLVFDDTAEEMARVQSFQRQYKLALFAETHPGSYAPGSVHEVYGLKFDVLFEKDLLAGALEAGGYAVLYAPGGGLPEVRNPMALQDRVRAFVRGGGGYLGICAGMNEASSEWAPDRSANLFKTPTVHLAGTDLLEVRLTDPHPLLHGVDPAYFDPVPSVRFMHMSGSLLKLASGEGTASVARAGLASELGAAGSFIYGQGRGVVWCPHPECGVGWGWWQPSDRTARVLRRLFRNSVYFAAGALPDRGNRHGRSTCSRGR